MITNLPVCDALGFQGQPTVYTIGIVGDEVRDAPSFQEGQTRIETLLQLRMESPPAPPVGWYLRSLRPKADGGTITPQDLDAALEGREITALKVSGLDQKSFEHLCTRYCTQLTAIHFWKCPRIEDLSPLEEMRALTHVSFYWNQRATRLWNLKKTSELQGLHFDDFRKLQNLNDLENCTSLVELSFGNAVWTKLTLPSLEPLSSLANLRSLHFNLKKVVDGRITPLGSLVGLKELEFSAGLFSTAQLAWLRARLPAEVNSTVLQPFWTLVQPTTNDNGTKELDTLVMGKGKPFLSSHSDSARLQRYIQAFNDAVLKYATHPELNPDTKE